MEAETGVTLPQIKDCLWSPEVGGARRVLSWSLRREHGPADTVISNVQPVELRDGIEVLSRKIGGTLSQQP